MEISSYFADSSTRIPATLAIFILTLITGKIILNLIWKDNSPPGPTGVPILGYLPFLGAQPHITFTNLRKEYGDIFSIKMGSFPAVVICGQTLIKEAFVNRGDEFSGRPEFVSSHLLGMHTLSFGLFNEIAIQHKRMASNVLHVYSNPRKNPTEDIVNYESMIVADEILKFNGKPFNPKDIISTSVGSIIFQICFGKDTDIRESDSYFKDFILNSSEASRFTGSGNPFDVMPFLRFVMPWKVAAFADLVSRFKAIIENKVVENMKTYSPSHMRHLTDGLISVYKENESIPDSPMTYKRIFSTLIDILGAGFETVSTTLIWSLLLLSAYPEVQAKVHKEIDDVLGKRPPKLEDKSEMHYCMATINEILRYCNIVPLPIPHAATKDSELNGFTIRKGTIVIANTYSVSHDEKIWGDPFSFRPERYLDSEGQLDQTVTERFNIFSFGRRKCLGESLARIELFLFITGILQHCKFTKPDHVDEYTLDSVFGLTSSPLPFELCASIRGQI